MIDSEKKVEKTLREEAKKRGGLALKLETNYFSGLPDRLVLLPGKVIFFVELKTTKQKAKKLQGVIHAMIRKLGFDVIIIDTVEDAKKIIEFYART